MLRANLERAGVASQIEVVVARFEDAAVEWSRPISLTLDRRRSRVRERPQRLGAVGPHAGRMPSSPFTTPSSWRAERVVQELLIRSRRYTSFVHADTTTAARRCGRLSPRDAVARQASLVRRGLYGRACPRLRLEPVWTRQDS